MKQHVQVAVIGGGAVGCSIIYHLTKLGWTDVVLLEKAELTAGSTWHAASNGNTFHGNPAFARLHKMTYDLRASLPEETGQETSFHRVGGINIQLSDAGNQ
ncbi:MAG: NAD(P)/FAD-dependent oxidoreductase [Gammaproteobacteria bacterium]